MQNIFKIIAEVLSVPVAKVNLESGPLDLPGWDSLAHLNILSAIEQTFGVELTMSEMLTVKSVNDICVMLKSHGVEVG